jgi:hypothetical protein
MSATLRYGATVTFSRRLLTRASRPVIGLNLEGKQGVGIVENVINSGASIPHAN